MKNEVFNFGNQEVSVVISENNEPMFIAKDVCTVLDIKNTTQAMNQLDEEEKLTYVLDRSGQNRAVNVITESGLYSLVLRSNKPEAKLFKKWITSEVLPSIRKHGMYANKHTIEEMLTSPDFAIKTLQALKEERAEKERLQKQVKAQEIKIDFIDRVLDVEEKIDIGQSAKILELPFGRNTLFKKLRENGVFFKNRNEPQQKYIDKGYFQLKEKFIERDNHDSFMIVKVLVTQRGLGFLSTMFKAKPNQKKLAHIE